MGAISPGYPAEARNRAGSNTVTLSIPKGESNREHKADLNPGADLPTRQFDPYLAASGYPRSNAFFNSATVSVATGCPVRNTPVRMTPEVLGKIVAWVGKNTKVRVVGGNSEFVEVPYPQGPGYVERDDLKFDSEFEG